MRSLNHRLRTWLAGGLALCLLRRGISFAAKGMDVERLVRSSVPNCRSITFQNEQLMGFSGAKVADVRCVRDDAEELLLFLKVVEPTPLPATASAVEKQKWERNLQSYANELAFFLNRDLQKALEKHSVLVPKLYGHESVPGRRYVLLTENLKPSWTTWAVHPATRSPEVFRWLAGFHGAFQGLLPEHTLWDFGTHVHLDRRPSKELENLPQSIADFCRDFAGLDPFFGRPESRLLGQRLQSVARKVSEHLSPGPENRPRVTLVHGDFKGANYFLKNEGEGCCAFDWQWTGPGLGATDLIYLFCGSVEDEIVQDYQRWLKLYHDHLIQTAGAVEQYNYSFDAFLLDFKAATLDYARWVFAYRLMGDTPEKFRARAENVDVNLGLFRRHPPRIRWLLQLVEEFLSDFEE